MTPRPPSVPMSSLAGCADLTRRDALRAIAVHHDGTRFVRLEWLAATRDAAVAR